MNPNWPQAPSAPQADRLLRLNSGVPQVLELHGWGDLHTELHRLSLEGQWDAMGSLIDDEILEAFAVVAPVDTVASKIRGRCDGVIDRVLVGFPSSISEPTATAVLRELRGQPIESTRRCS